jgi:translation initiation factor IF-2
MSESTKKKIKVKLKKTKDDISPNKVSDISDIYREKTIKESLKPTPKKEELKKPLLSEEKKSLKDFEDTKKKENLESKVSIEKPKESHEQIITTPNKLNIEQTIEKQEFAQEEKPLENLEEISEETEESTKLPEKKNKKFEKKKEGKKFYHHRPTYKEITSEGEVKTKKHQKEIENEILYSKKESVIKKKETPKPIVPSVPKEITITESIQVAELAKKLNVKPNDLIKKLISLGVMATINQVLDVDTATIVAAEYGAEVKVVSLYDETVIIEDEDKIEDRVPRPPVVTIMGHVDHGKTKLLDTIRKSNIAEKEAGAITQHIGAYQVITPKGKITFLDTPGHEAFTAMRARGASITDIVVLVVAADDGVKEQTVEAIHHAQAANVPIIVAINKIDLPTANPERVKQELVQYGLQPEEWGGDTIYCEISAKNNIGIDNLLDMILIQAELMELKANPKVKPVGRVIESKKDPGKGPVATILVQKGTLKEGMPFVVGIYAGKVRAMFDDLGRRIKEAGPSTPVEIIGIEDVPEPGDPFHVVESEKEAREIASKRQYYKQMTQTKRKQPSLKDLDEWTKEHKELNIIIKADVHGSVEAIRDGLLKLSNEEVKVNVIYGAAGPITESDVNLALASNAIIVAFQVRASSKAQELAEQNNVEIKYYSIIYNLLEDIEKALKGMLEPQYKEVITGEAEVRQVFRISKVGNVAGCMVRKGKINRNDKLRLIRNGVVIYEGEVNQLKRFKEDVAEVAEGYECGISIKDYNDLKEGDIIEFYRVEQIVKS